MLRNRTLITAGAAFALATTSTCVLAENLREPTVSRHSFFEGWDPGEPYALDGERRHLEEDEKVECAPDEMVRHRSKALRYTVTTHPEFAARLERFEAFVIALATEHYGRAPKRLVHKGVFACRTLRSRKARISEHALGNALDFQGLDFGPLPRKSEAPEALPRPLRRGFSIRVLKHWTPKRKLDAYHARFLHRLVEELRLRPDIFRGIVGPPRPRHFDHLQLDAAPWRYALYGFDEPS